MKYQDSIRNSRGYSAIKCVKCTSPIVLGFELNPLMAFGIKTNTVIVIHALRSKEDINVFITTSQMLHYFMSNRLDQAVRIKVH